jgi:hypothetical protein
MTYRLSPTHGLVLAIILAAIASGCAAPLDPPTAPSISSEVARSRAASTGTGSLSEGALQGLSGTFYPLQLGNRWHYRRHLVYTLIPYEGEPSPPIELDATIDRGLICTEQRDGREYMVEQAEEHGTDASFTTWIRFRQDRAGLYEADVTLQDPPACVTRRVPASSGGGREVAAGLAGQMEALIPAGPPARSAAFRVAVERLQAKLALIDAALGTMTRTPAGSGAQFVGAGELTRLRYPLYPGARWIIRNAPGAIFAARVEGTDVLTLPAGRLRGYRIRISSDGLGPNDTVRTWYGTSGLLQIVVHGEYEAIDVFGQPIGRVFVDQREALEELQLSGPIVVWPPAGRWPLGQ